MKSLLEKMGILMPEKTSDIASDIAIRPTAVTAPQVLDGSNNQGFLAGQLLVATPVIESGCFQKSVIYLFAHNAEGAMGLVINQPLELLNYAALVEGVNLPPEAGKKQIPVFFGGPVERARGFVIHSTDYSRETAVFTNNELAVTASSSILHDLVAGNGPKNAALVVGYAGWTAGQLEQEIEQNSWITVPATANLVFGTENDLKWATASKSLGFDMAFFSTTVGHA